MKNISIVLISFFMFLTNVEATPLSQYEIRKIKLGMTWSETTTKIQENKLISFEIISREDESSMQKDVIILLKKDGKNIGKIFFDTNVLADDLIVTEIHAFYPRKKFLKQFKITEPLSIYRFGILKENLSRYIISEFSNSSFDFAIKADEKNISLEEICFKEDGILLIFNDKGDIYQATLKKSNDQFVAKQVRLE